MIALIHRFAPPLLIGAGAGSLLAARWTEVIHRGTPSGMGPAINSLVIPWAGILLLFTALILLAVGRSPARDHMVTVVAALVALVIAGMSAGLASLSAALEPAGHALRLLPGAALIAAALPFRRRWPVYCGTALLVAALAPPVSVSRVAGDAHAAQAASYAPLSLSPLLIDQFATFASLGCIAGLASAYLRRTNPLLAALRGLATGAAAALTASTLHATALLTAMASGTHPLLIWLAIASTAAIAALLCAVAYHAWLEPRASLLLRLAPVPFLLILAALITVLSYGGAEYAALSRYHPDLAYTYVHFTGDGSWTRTLDEHGNTTRLWRCRQFLAIYPRSAYRPAALITLAQCQINLWQFRDAARTLSQVVSTYPYLSGEPRVLAALSQLAAGQPRMLLSEADPLSPFGAWRRTQGALLTATAARRAGQPYRALGHCAAYEEYLATADSASWTHLSAAYSRAQAQAVIDDLRAGHSGRRTGTVRTRITAGGEPVRDARIVLVQPHIDAALIPDSRQFTGAWSVAAWHGSWGVTDRDGCVEIREVPYGEYEVVLGLALSAARRGYVVSQAIRPVTVNRRYTALPELRLVRSVELSQPTPGESVPPSVRLEWLPYPGASTYTVTLVTLDSAVTPAAVGRNYRRGQTCWTRSGIRATSAYARNRHFLNGHTRLEPGASYMWMVHAYDAQGRLLSSSEHYHDILEPAFTVRRMPATQTNANTPTTRGGTLK